jgi:hypothetical protein
MNRYLNAFLLNNRSIYCLMVLFLLGGTESVIAQDLLPFSNTGEAKPVYFFPKKFETEGSSFLFEDFRLAEVTLENGKMFPYANLKLDLFENKIFYQSKDGVLMEVMVPVKKLRFWELNSKDGELQPSVEIVTDSGALNSPKAPIYEVIVDGRIRLLKRKWITYTDNVPYGGGASVRTFKLNQTLFAQINSNEKPVIKIKKNNKDIASLFKDKSKEVNRYIDSEKLNCKLEQDLLKVFVFYNSL